MLFPIVFILNIPLHLLLRISSTIFQLSTIVAKKKKKKKRKNSRVNRSVNILQVNKLSRVERVDYWMKRGRLSVRKTRLLTALFLILRWRYQRIEADTFVELDTEDQSDFQQDTLKLADTDVIYRSSAEFPKEFLCS